MDTNVNGQSTKGFEEMSHEELLSACNLLVKQRDMAINKANQVIMQAQRQEDAFNLNIMFDIIKYKEVFPDEYVESIIAAVMDSFRVSKDGESTEASE